LYLVIVSSLSSEGSCAAPVATRGQTVGGGGWIYCTKPVVHT
jgi:hypothetical protein